MSPPTGRPAQNLSVDVADLAWGPLTVRVAWTLLGLNVKPHPEMLTTVREHVIHHLDPEIAVAAAEDQAEALTRRFVAAARGQAYEDTWPQDASMPLSPRWHGRLSGSLAPLAAWVLRLHYADGVELPRVAARTGEDLLAVEAAREGLREVVRRAASDDGVPLDTWPEGRLDQLMHRLACMAADGGPSLLDIADGKHPDWTQRCVRAARAWTLVQRGYIARSELIVPPGGGRRDDTVTAVVLQLQRDARGRAKGLARELGVLVVPVGDDRLLVDGADLERVREVLVLAAEVGLPNRDQLRGVVVKGPGRWSRYGLIGPLVGRLDGALRPVPWGTVEGIGELPPPLPEPPSARAAWAGVAALAAMTVAIGWSAVRPAMPAADHPLWAEASPGRGGVWVRFDVDEDAYVLVVRERDGALEVVLDSRHPGDKIKLATGDGSYLTHLRADGVLVASFADAYDGVADLVSASRAEPRPIEALAARLHTEESGADVWTWTM